MSTNTRDIHTFSNVSTDQSFTLKGGRYALMVIATWNAGSVTLERQAADGSTYIAVVAAFSANAFSVLDLPVGKYKLVVATATGVYCDITGIAVPLL